MEERLLTPLNLGLGGELVSHASSHLRPDYQHAHHDKRDERDDAPPRAPSTPAGSS
jgi:hypothetical protein